MFVDWAIANDCAAQVVARTRATGQPYTSLEISAPSGARLAIPRPNMNQRLEPSLVVHYQRRLGIKSPFAAMPPEPSCAADDEA